MELDMEDLETLDMQENVPTVYNRKTLEVSSRNKRIVRSLLIVLPRLSYKIEPKRRHSLTSW